MVFLWKFLYFFLRILFFNFFSLYINSRFRTISRLKKTGCQFFPLIESIKYLRGINLISHKSGGLFFFFLFILLFFDHAWKAMSWFYTPKLSKYCQGRCVERISKANRFLNGLPTILWQKIIVYLIMQVLCVGI